MPREHPMFWRTGWCLVLWAVLGGWAATGKVALTVKADAKQPAGGPVVVEVTMTNIGPGAISWWCGGPDKYPGAEHLAVKVRYGEEAPWHKTGATNGQYTMGSGRSGTLQPGAAIVVPLAIPVDGAKRGTVRFSIEAGPWQAAEPAHGRVELVTDREIAERRQAREIAAVRAHGPPFWLHLAERYTDKAVLDATLRLVAADDGLTVSGAAAVLARQRALPAGAGEVLARAVGRWLPRRAKPQWGGLQEYLVEAALNTQSEVARAAVLQRMAETTDARTCALIVDRLSLSPGDKAWLRRAKAAIIALPPAATAHPEVAHQKDAALKFLDLRISGRAWVGEPGSPFFGHVQ